MPKGHPSWLLGHLLLRPSQALVPTATSLGSMSLLASRRQVARPASSLLPSRVMHLGHFQQSPRIKPACDFSTLRNNLRAPPPVQRYHVSHAASIFQSRPSLSRHIRRLSDHSKGPSSVRKTAGESSANAKAQENGGRKPEQAAGAKDTGTTHQPATDDSQPDAESLASSVSKYLHLPRMPHRPTKEELLAAATNFRQRMKVRLKWMSIRSMRPWNIDEWGAFVSWVMLGHIVWILLGTTTFFSIIILSINTVFAQGKRLPASTH